MKKEPRAEIRPRLLCCAGLAAAATAATAVSVTVAVTLAAAPAATEAAVRKQDDDNNENQQAVVTKTTEVHNAPPFPEGLKAFVGCSRRFHSILCGAENLCAYFSGAAHRKTKKRSPRKASVKSFRLFAIKPRG